MLQNLFSIRHFRLQNRAFWYNVPYIHLSHDSILEMRRIFPNNSVIEPAQGFWHLQHMRKRLMLKPILTFTHGLEVELLT